MNDKEHKYCLRCNRKLKNPKARLIGYGVVCLKKMQLEENPIHISPLFEKVNINADSTS